MFHINRSGEIKKCTAKKECPFMPLDLHFETREDAEKSIEKSHSMFTTLKNKAQDNNATDYERNILEALSTYNRPLFAYAPRGSRLYGLHNEKSDFDLTILEYGKNKPIQRIIGEFDYYTHSIGSLQHALSTGELTETDMLYSGQLMFTDDRYKEFFNAYRISPYKYYSRGRRWAEETLKLHPRDGINASRFPKDCKISARTTILSNKFVFQGQEFNPVFTQEEKELWFELTDFAKNLMIKSDGDHILTTDHLLHESFDFFNK